MAHIEFVKDTINMNKEISPNFQNVNLKDELELSSEVIVTDVEKDNVFVSSPSTEALVQELKNSTVTQGSMFAGDNSYFCKISSEKNGNMNPENSAFIMNTFKGIQEETEEEKRNTMTLKLDNINPCDENMFISDPELEVAEVEIRTLSESDISSQASFDSILQYNFKKSSCSQIMVSKMTQTDCWDSIVKTEKKQMAYLNCQNFGNTCWLDAIIMFICHSKSFAKNVATFTESQINNNIVTYNEAVAILNDNSSNIKRRFEEPLKLLRKIQKNSWNYLNPFLKLKEGLPESAFCALYCFISNDKSSIKQNLSVSWIVKYKCNSCGAASSSLRTNPIITLTEVTFFQPECPSHIYTCVCKNEATKTIIFKELSSCLIFHFQNGAGTGGNLPLSFIIEARQYNLTFVIMLGKTNDPSVKHFVTWVRDATEDMWMECNDLKNVIINFTEDTPKFNLINTYLCVYEAFDDLGKIYPKISADEEQSNEIKEELIYLSDEDSESATNTLKKSKIIQNMEDEEIEEVHSKNELSALPHTAIFVHKKDIGEEDNKVTGVEEYSDVQTTYTPAGFKATQISLLEKQNSTTDHSPSFQQKKENLKRKICQENEVEQKPNAEESPSKLIKTVDNSYVAFHEKKII